MAEQSKTGELFFELNGSSAKAPLEWKDIEILATFNDEAVQGTISPDSFTFYNENAFILSNWKNPYEGPDFKLIIRNRDSETIAFDGFLDLVNNFTIDLEQSRTIAGIKTDDIGDLTEKIESLTYGYLKFKGAFNGSDTEIKYVVEKKVNAFEILVSAVILYLMIKELAESIKETSRAIANAASILAGGGATGGIGAAIYAVAEALLIAAYTTILLVQIIELGTKMINTFIPPVRKAQTTNLRTLLANVVEYLGYEFETNITDLDNTYYLPSNDNVDEVNDEGFINFPKGPLSGLPAVQDFGYNCLDMFQSIASMFRASFAIQGNKVLFYNKFDQFWVKTSTYVMKSQPAQPYSTNAADLKANKLFRFETDIRDDWTIDESEGTYFEAITDQISTQNERRKQVKGFQETSWVTALGSRKSKLNALEKFLAEVAGAVDEIADLFGDNPRLKDRVKSKVGMLRVTDNNYTKPKILKLEGGSIPTNYRSVWGAEYLYNTYHYGDSFVLNNFYGQKTVYKGVRIALGYEDYLKLINNSYFITFDGREGKITEMKWNPSEQIATVDYWIREPFTTNLKETTREL